MWRLGVVGLAFGGLAMAAEQQQHLRGLQQTTPYVYSISLALEYLEPAIAEQLESSDPTNEIKAHFCSAVHTQAGGTQVQTYAQALSVQIETRTFERGDGSNDYGCRVLATNRVYDETGEALFGAGVLALQITVQQIVFISGSLSDNQKNNILESGFNRGDGGRIKFRALLQEHAAFGKLINVEVIDGPVAPIPPPSVSPTAVPVVADDTWMTPSPSLFLPSDLPSNFPTTAALRSEESSVPPTFAPTLSTNMPSVTPSAAPVLVLMDSSTDPSPTNRNNSQPLILGAIAGGIATIIVSCFFIFCVWFPFCGNRKRRLPPRYEPSDPASAASSRDLYAESAIPGEGKARERAATNDSFDESSIYTSTFSTDNKFQTRITAVDIFGAAGGIQEEESHELSSESPMESSVGSASSLMDGHLLHDPLEEAKEEMDFARCTKGFDPFADDSDSSFALGGSVAMSADPSYGTPVKDISKFSPSSTKTKRTDNLVVRVEANVVSSVDGSIEVEEGKEDGNSILANSEIYEASQHSRDSSISSSTSLSNNALLRSVLENARRRERSGSSRVSLKSAPSRVNHGARSRMHDANRRGARLVDHLASENVRSNGRGASSRSIGVRSLVSFSDGRRSKRTSHISYSDQSPQLPGSPHLRASYGSPDLASPFSSYSSADYGNDKMSSAASDVSGAASPHLYDDGSWDGEEEKDNSRAPSPGVLGIASISDGTPSDIEGMPDIDRLSYPWLFEGGTDSGSMRHERHDSAGSTWSVRSNRSVGSAGVDSIQDWTPKKSNSGRPPRPHGHGTPMDDYKLVRRGGGSTTSRTLEHDLNRLRDMSGYKRTGTRTVVSTASAPSSSSIKSVPYRQKEKKQRLNVVAPPGKIGVVLSNRLDGRGTYISEVRPSSTLRHFVRPGDKLVAIDGEDVSSVSVNDITDIMQAKSSLERRLTLITAYVTDEATFHTHS